MELQADTRGNSFPPSLLNGFQQHEPPSNLKAHSTLLRSSPGAYPREPASLIDILENAARAHAVCTYYPHSGVKSGQPERTTSYAQLLSLAKAKAPLLSTLAEGGQRGTAPPIVLLHFDSIEDNITWFWATVAAGLSPAISTPLPTNVDQRHKHLSHLTKVLDKPIVLTKEHLVSELRGMEGVNISSVENLGEHQANTDGFPGHTSPNIFMLTSGSSGNAKAVELHPLQIIAAIKGKSTGLGIIKNDVFLNFIGFDHVANLTECHLYAMYLGADQIHVPAREVISDPWLFLSIINEHRVTATFAPNFFLARLLRTMDESSGPKDSLDLSCLRRITSGGEANVVETALRLTNALRQFGTGDDLICPGFGMTETCAGSIYNRICPTYDIERGYEFSSLGKPVNGIQMRVMKADGTLASPNEVGDLQVTGSIVFQRYYNNPTATAEAFTQDGWFITDDRAFIDDEGCLSLSGRGKEVINLNGVKYFPNEIEAALEEAGQSVTGMLSSYTCVFSTRPKNSQKEEICVLYHPTFPLDDIESRIATADMIVRIVGERTSARPKHIVPLPQQMLPKSALGKLSRAKLRIAFEKGEFSEYEDNLNVEVKNRRAALCIPPSSDTEKLILQELAALFGETFDDRPVGVNNSIFDLGVTSTDLFLLSHSIQQKAGLSQSIPVGTLLTDPTIRGIASAMDQLGRDTSTYVPIVPLQREGSKTPLFLIHPGSGDVLVFVALSKYFPDRPVYGIRTRGLYSSDDYFKSLHEMADCYTQSIKQIQPKGPYAVAGYSLGSSVAFEVAKKLESMGDQVPFLGILDSPPHIRQLIGHLDFIDVLLNVAYFLELITEDYAVASQVPLHDEHSEDDALDIVLRSAPPHRLDLLSIDKPRLRKITEVTHSFGSAGKSYEPTGMVTAMDIFWVTPLLWVAKNRKEWMDLHLSKWTEFSLEDPRFHECEGMHSKFLNTDFVDGFAKTLRAVIEARGL